MSITRKLTRSLPRCSWERLHVISGVMGSWWSLTSSIDYVASVYYGLYCTFFLPWIFFQLQQRQLLLPLCQWRLQLVRLQLVFDYHNIIDRTRTRIVMQHTEVRIFHLHHSIAAQTCNNFGGLRTEILPQKNRDQIFLIGIFLQIMACKLTNLSDSHLIKVVLL